MQWIDGQRVYSATDLVGFLACQYLTVLDHAALDGHVPHPRRFDDDLEVLRKRGFEHERRYRDELVSQGKRVIEILPDGSDTSYAEHLWASAKATIQAMADGWDVIYQGTFFDGRWRGHPDFMLRVDDPTRPSRFGAYHYEIADTKLSRHAKAGAVLQICSYVDHLERAQELRPARMHVVLGGSSRHIEVLRVDDFMAYYRNVRDRFLAASADPDMRELERAPEPAEHCAVCRWDDRCADHRRRVDHLTLVANITTRQRHVLGERGITTLTSLGQAEIPFNPALMGASRHGVVRAREQARIQLEGRESGQLLHELLAPIEPSKGLASLPAPSVGDLFFDIEGDPYAFDDGLDYLFGVLEPSKIGADGAPLFHALWSADPDGDFSLEGEKRAFEALIDLIMDRLRADPAMHIYHYAPYEPTALKRLMGRYGTREDEVDHLLRGGVLVDLYRAVRQGLRASVESYSIKKIEAFYGFKREVELRDATSSIVEFERWLQIGSEERPGAHHLDQILLYNRDDVVSTWQLRNWLEKERTELVAQGIEVPRPESDDGAPTEDLGSALERVALVAERLTRDVPSDPKEQQARWLLAQLLSWHRREEKSTWWRYYYLMTELTDEERIEEKEPLGGLEFLDVVGETARSRIYRYRFPHQEHDLDVGDTVHDPETKKSAGTVFAIDEIEHVIDLIRGKASKAPHPTSVVPLDLINTTVLRESLLRLGEWVAERGVQSGGAFQAGRDLLLRSQPRLSAPTTGASLLHAGEGTLQGAVRLGLSLDHSVLPIQGPPGAGKTHTGARMIVELLRAGKTVGITANSHKVICNLLGAACRAAEEAAVRLRAVQKGDADEVLQNPSVTQAATNDHVVAAIESGSTNLVAGTAWLWARADMAEAVDVLFIDEAGQMSLANALAISQGAKSLVLLGDPLQLDQPIKGVHPPGVAVSALGHILGEHATIQPDQGLFLEETWRLHPDLCEFTSHAFYEGKLTAESRSTAQRLNGSSNMAGTGTRVVYVPHNGNDSESPEEAATIAEMVREVVEGGTSWIDRSGTEHPITWDDVLIVAAYNAQVAAIRALLPPEARVGTVDKFQGQEAPISIYSMASSSAEDAPRGMGFLFNRHRLNVATSRARCVVVVVCSPELTRVRARTLHEMRLANALCQFVESAGLTANPQSAYS